MSKKIRFLGKRVLIWQETDHCRKKGSTHNNKMKFFGKTIIDIKIRYR